MCPDFKGLGGEVHLVIFGFVEDAGFFVVEVSQALLVGGRLVLEKRFVGADDLFILAETMDEAFPELDDQLDAFGRFVSSEIKRWAEVVKSSGAKLD